MLTLTFTPDIRLVTTIARVTHYIAFTTFNPLTRNRAYYSSAAPATTAAF